MNEREFETKLSLVADGFSDFILEQPGNYGNDGSFMSIASQFKTYVNSHPEKVIWKDLGDFINTEVTSQNTGVELALCSCLIEKIADKRHPLGGYLHGAALKFWNYWI